MDNPNPILYENNAKSSSDVSDPLIIEVFDVDLIRDIKDPEHPHTLEELNVVSDEWISIQYGSTGTSSLSETCSGSSWDAETTTPSTATQDGTDEKNAVIRIEFRPTVPHCSLATLIGLCLRVKLERTLVMPYKLDILVGEGTHSIEEDVNKQINDKERVAAAMENPGLRDMVEECIKEVDY